MSAHESDESLTDATYDNPETLRKLALLEKHDPANFPESRVLAMLATEIEVARVKQEEWKKKHDPETIRALFAADPLEVRLRASDRPEVTVRRTGDQLKVRWAAYRGEPARSISLTLEPGGRRGGALLLDRLQSVAFGFARQRCPYADRAAATPRKLLAAGRRIAEGRVEEDECGNRWRAGLSIETVADKLEMRVHPELRSEVPLYAMIEEWRLIAESFVAGEGRPER